MPCSVSFSPGPRRRMAGRSRRENRSAMLLAARARGREQRQSLLSRLQPDHQRLLMTLPRFSDSLFQRLVLRLVFSALFEVGLQLLWAPFAHDAGAESSAGRRRGQLWLRRTISF